MFLVMSCTSSGALLACLLGINAVTDRAHRLHSARLAKRGKGGGDPLLSLLHALRRVGPASRASKARSYSPLVLFARLFIFARLFPYYLCSFSCLWDCGHAVI
jgi:hypothetical protein